MIFGFNTVRALAIAATIGFAFPIMAGASDGLRSASDGLRSGCDDPEILSQIQVRLQAGSESHDENSAIPRILATGLRYQALCEPLALTHDQCAGRAILSDGSEQRIFYTVTRRRGSALVAENIRLCSSWLPTRQIHSPTCTTVR